MENEQRFRQAKTAAMVGIVGNMALAAVKAAVGVWSQSQALIADAAHSASDVAGSFAVWVGLRAAARPQCHGSHQPVQPGKKTVMSLPALFSFLYNKES